MDGNNHAIKYELFTRITCEVAPSIRTFVAMFSKFIRFLNANDTLVDIDESLYRARERLF